MAQVADVKDKVLKLPTDEERKQLKDSLKIIMHDFEFKKTETLELYCMKGGKLNQEQSQNLETITKTYQLLLMMYKSYDCCHNCSSNKSTS